MLGEYRDKMLEGRHFVCQDLGDAIFLDVVSLGIYFHRPQWIWTNLTPLYALAATFSTTPPPFDQKVDNILDPNRTFFPVV